MADKNLIKDLYQLAETCPQEQFQRRALNALQQLIQFDSGGWGEVALCNNSLTVLRAHSYNLPPEHIEDYNKVQHLNPIGSHLVLGNARSMAAHIDDPTLDIDEEFRAYVKKYDVSRTLATTSQDRTQLFYRSIGLFRKHRNFLFSDEDLKNKERIYPHLIESFRFCRRFDVQRKLLKRWELNRGLATCNEDGVLLDADDRFVEFLRDGWPNWQSAQLPPGMIQGLFRDGLFRTEKAFYRSIFLEDLFLISAAQLGLLAELTKREFQIAYIYSNGSTAREISNELSVSPITVKNHLANIYNKLKLDSKENLKNYFLSE